jgi:hypothetical protein
VAYSEIYDNAHCLRHLVQISEAPRDAHLDGQVWRGAFSSRAVFDVIAGNNFRLASTMDFTKIRGGNIYPPPTVSACVNSCRLSHAALQDQGDRKYRLSPKVIWGNLPTRNSREALSRTQGAGPHW